MLHIYRKTQLLYAIIYTMNQNGRKYVMLFSKDYEDRFKIIYKQGMVTGFRIIQDRETGVNYLMTFEGSAGGLTPLLDENGKPVVTPVEDDY